MAVASASFTIMDYTDSISLSTGIESNQPLTSIFDPEAAEGEELNPSWASSTKSLILTPRVMKAGSSTNLVPKMTGFTWYRRITGETDFSAVTSGSNGETVSTDGNQKLTVKQDKLTGNTWTCEYKFSGTYTDETLGLPLTAEAVITFNRVSNGSSFVRAMAYTPDGNVFRNSEEPSSLTIEAKLMRKAGQDETNVEYRWYKYSNGSWGSQLNAASTVSTQKTWTVYPTDVDYYALYKCVITDTDPASTTGTGGQSFSTDGIVIYDYSDPIHASIESSAGDTFRKGESSSSILTCRLWRNGEELDTTGEAYSYSWSMTDNSGNAKTFSYTPVTPDGTSIVTTNKKAIKISSTDVVGKSTYFCEVTKL